MPSKEEVEREAAALNQFAKRVNTEKFPCDGCNGSGRSFAPLHGDPGLGYADNGPCPYCQGTGKDQPPRVNN